VITVVEMFASAAWLIETTTATKVNKA